MLYHLSLRYIFLGLIVRLFNGKGEAMPGKNCACSLNRDYFDEPIEYTRTIGQQWSEDDILYLEDIFLTPGFHKIKVDDVNKGRSLVYILLQSLHCYQEVACLSCLKIPLKKTITDIYMILLRLCQVHEYHDAVELYFLEYFQAQVLWIELSDELFEDPIMYCALQVIHDFNIMHSAPIIALSYNRKTI